MKLLFVRHGKAEEASFSRWPDDSARPLTDAGADRFRRSVRRIVRLAGRCDAVFTSPYERAAATAEILSEEAGWPTPIEDARLSGNKGVGDAFELADEQDSRGCYALVGHDPAISLCVSQLIGAGMGSVGLKPGGVALLEVHGDVDPSSMVQLIGLLQPKVLAKK